MVLPGIPNTAAMLVVLGLLQPAVVGSRAPGDAADGVRHLLAAPCEGWSDVPRLQDQLVALGPTALPELLGVLAGRDAGSDSEVSLDGMRRVAVSGAIERMPRLDVLAHLERVSRSDVSGAERMAGLRMLERIAGPRELPLVARLGGAGPGEEGAGVERLEACEKTFRVVIRRHPEAAGWLLAKLRELPGETRRPAIRAVAARGDQVAFEALLDALGEVDPLDASILVEVRQLMARGMRPDAHRMDALREALDHRDPAARSLAVLALQDLGDAACIPDLLDLLEDPGAGAAAHQALCKFARRRIPRDRGAWSAWLDAEHGWWETRSPALLGNLRADDASTVLSSIAELAEHPLFADEMFSNGLGAVIRRREPRLAALTCRVAAELGARSACKDLVDGLEHSSLEVRNAAHRALCDITGLTMPPDPILWKNHSDE